MEAKKINIRKTLICLLTAAMLVSASLPAGAAQEAPEKTFNADPNGAVILNNLVFSDVTSSNTGYKNAIYEASALEIIKGLKNMNRRFGRTDTLSKEEAIALAYRAAGREAEAQVLGENLNNARAAADRKKDPVDVWSDGFLQLAANEGLISRQDMADALNADQSSLEDGSFKRASAAQRQEIALWLAQTLNLQPVRGQQNLFNSYTDWRSADPDKIPYIEAVLQNGIMNGAGNGRFNPTQSVTREQAAQIVKNAESQVLAALKLTKYTGVVERITDAADYSSGGGINLKSIGVRNSNGKLHVIKTSSPLSAGPGRNEQAGTQTAGPSAEIVAYKNGAIGNSSILKAGDRLEYITDAAGTVRFVNVISNANDVSYMAAQIKNIDTANQLINVIQLFSLNYPDIGALSNAGFAAGSDAVNKSFRYSGSVSVTINGANATIGDLSPDSAVILTITGNNTVTAVQSLDLGINAEEKNIVRGIVEENNPQLGYITLYNEDGTGTGKTAAATIAAVRTYSYTDQNRLEVLRNHAPAQIDTIQTGDTAYLRLDEDGNVTSVSAVDNYEVRYGRVLTKQPGSIIVQYDNGTQQILTVGADVLVIRDKKLTDLKTLKDGDRVKLILNTNNKSTDLKEITVEGTEHLITNIYKGVISGLDAISDKVTVMNLQIFNKGRWDRADRKGFTSIPLSAGCVIYYGDREMDRQTANRLLNSNEAYIAVEADYGGIEKAAVVSFRNGDDTEVLYSDDITGAVLGSDSFGLLKEFKRVGYNAGSIVVKNGRLVSGNSLADNDRAYLAVNRSYGSGELNAGVVRVEEAASPSGSILYRARIKQINDNQDFTVESFSQLTGNKWVYYNTPKTFRLTFNTSLLGDDGVVNIRNFTDYGEDSYINRVVYIMADGTDATLISTAPFGAVAVKGTVYEMTGAQYGEEGTLTGEPDGLVIRKVKTYNTTTFKWTDDVNMTLNILENTIIIKNGRTIKGSEIKKGDTVTIIRKDAAATGDACIITVE